MAIGDGLIDPYNEWDYGPVMYQFGLIDERQLEYVNLQTQLARHAIELKEYLVAYSLFGFIIDEFYSNAHWFTWCLQLFINTRGTRVGLFMSHGWQPARIVERFMWEISLTTMVVQRLVRALANDVMQSIVGKVAVICQQL